MNSNSDSHKFIGFFVSLKLRRAIEAKAKEEGLSLSYLIRKILRDALKCAE